MIISPVIYGGGRGASFHFVLDLTYGSSSLNGVHISEGDVVQVTPGRICLLETSFEGDRKVLT